MADSNAPVQEKALDALIAFLRAADADAGRYCLLNLGGFVNNGCGFGCDCCCCV